jgi:O-methyltransferase
MKKIIKKIFDHLGYDIYKKNKLEIKYPIDFKADEIQLINSVIPYTMTSPERIYSLIKSVCFIVKNEIPGDIVECGVWKGGSMMTVALTLLTLGDNTRNLYLFDTFEGMTMPTEKDLDFNNRRAYELYMEANGSQWCNVSVEEVQELMYSTGYPKDKLHFIKGRVEDTIPKSIPNKLSLIRLDTDWYESTIHELNNLFPVLSQHGILIIDDYGYWQGAKLAVDQYFAENSIKVFLSRIDDTGRLCVKL